MALVTVSMEYGKYGFVFRLRVKSRILRFFVEDILVARVETWDREQ